MAKPDVQRYHLPLLEEHVRVPAGARVFEQGYYDPEGALWAAARAGSVVALRPAIDLVTELDTLARERVLANVDVRLGVDLGPEDAERHDVALLLAPFFLGNAPVRAAIRTAAAALVPDGRLYVQVHRRHGGATYVRYAEELFEDVALLGMGGGQRRLYQAMRPRAAPPAGPPGPTRLAGPAGLAGLAGELETEPIEFAARGVTLRLRLAAGVFAARAIDPGSRLLLETIEAGPGSTILDLGCGAGVLGLTLAAADAEARTVLVDVSKAAVDLARENAARNRLSNVDVRLGDGYAPVAGERFDVIVSNLPAHRGHQVDTSIAERLIAGAARHLRPDGAVWFVANKALPYELAASRAFREVRLAATGARHKVLRCTQPRAEPRAEPHSQPRTAPRIDRRTQSRTDPWTPQRTERRTQSRTDQKDPRTQRRIEEQTQPRPRRGGATR